MQRGRYLRLVGVHQGGGGCHHGAAAWAGEGHGQRFGGALRLLLQDLAEALQVKHQSPVHALLRPMGLEQASQNRHVKVGPVPGALCQGQRAANRGRHPGE